MTVEGRVFSVKDDGMPAILTVDFCLSVLELKKLVLRSSLKVQLIQDSLLDDMIPREGKPLPDAPSYLPANETAYTLGFTNEKYVYRPAWKTFAGALVYRGPDGMAHMRYFGDVATDWINDGPELFRLLVAEMKNGKRFAMPEPMHNLCLAFAANMPEALARLLMERKLQNWIRPAQMLQWAGINPNKVTLPLVMSHIVDRPIIRYP